MRSAQREGRHRRPALLAAPVLATLLLITAAPALARDAYVANSGSESVSVIDTRTDQVVGSPITVGVEPTAIAITPDGRFAYVVNTGSGSVSVIDAQTKQVVGPPIAVGNAPYWIAITPDGRFAYVVNFFSASVSVIDTQTNQVVGSPTIGTEPIGIAITPDGRFAYVTSSGSQAVSIIDTQTNQVVGSPVAAPVPYGIAITPDGRFAYVANQALSGTVSVIDTQTNQVVGSPVAVGSYPRGIAITPDGGRAYVVNAGLPGSVSAIDTQTKQAIGAPIEVGTNPERIAITPDGRFAYVAKESGVSVIDTQTNQVIGSPILAGTYPRSIAIAPDQPPLAAFTVPVSRPGVPVAFNASGSSDADGSIARYHWSFGDGQTAPDGGVSPSHVYGAPGTYQAGLSLTDDEGCSTAFVFTGQTASCNGSALAGRTQTVTVAYPGVRVRCPRRAKPGGCRVRLRAVTRRRRGKPESAVAKARVKAGRTAVLSLRPKKAYRTRLATARKVLVRERLAIDGSKKTFFRKLKIVR